MDFKRLDELAAQVKAMRPLNQAELKRLRDEFVVENTYDSNAIEGNSLTLRETALILQEGITIAEKPLKDHVEAIGHIGMPLSMLCRLQAKKSRLQSVLSKRYILWC